MLSQLPIGLLYPLGKKQETAKPCFEQFYRKADIIAGDFHFLRYHLPGDLGGKRIITSTVTAGDVLELKRRGAEWLLQRGLLLQAGLMVQTYLKPSVSPSLAGVRRQIPPYTRAF
jgi:hypothetical protein